MEVICPFCKHKTELDGEFIPKVFICPECKRHSIDVGKVKREWFSFVGRASQGDFVRKIFQWLGISLVVGCLLGIFLGVCNVYDPSPYIFYVSLFLGIAAQIDFWGISVRRFHDFDSSGMVFIIIHVILIAIVTVVDCVIRAKLEDYISYYKAIELQILLGKWEAFFCGSNAMLLLILCLIPGTAGINKYGLKPNICSKIKIGNGVKCKVAAKEKANDVKLKVAAKKKTKIVIKKHKEEALEAETPQEAPQENK